MKKSISSCEPFELMISELIDGELNDSDTRDVQEHIQDCAACQELHSQFARVNAAVESLSANDRRLISAFADAKPRTEKSQTNVQRFAWRLIALSTAAALLFAVFVTFYPTTNSLTAKEFSPQDFAQPLKELHVLNMHQERDQELMLKTLSMDLRAMKLELNQLNDSEEQGELASEIDLMLAKVNQFDSF
jgi:anti-sigma-K factor RskA